MLVILAGLGLCSCAGKQPETTASGTTPQASQTQAAKDKEEAAREKAEREQRIMDSPYLITSDYFRETAGTNRKIKLFGDSRREKELEERLAKLEQRLQGLPERAQDASGLPVLRRKVVLLSLLGDLGLDALSLLPASLRRTEGLVPIDSNQLSTLLAEKGKTPADLVTLATRREIASAAGIHAYVLVYFPQNDSTQDNKSALRIDVIHAVEGILIGSYIATIDEFDSVAHKISEDVIRGTEWSCRVIKAEDGRIYLNSGRLTGLRPGDRLNVYGIGKEIIDPITKRSLGFAPGEFHGEIEIQNLFGTDASEAKAVSGSGFSEGDVAKMEQLG